MERVVGYLVMARGMVQRLEGVALLLARLTVGVLFVSTGWGKVHNLDKVIGFFTDLGIPAPAFQATLVSFTELIGGSLLVLGLFSRLAAAPLLVTMVVALLTAKKDDLHNVPDLFGVVEWTYLVILFVIIAVGPGLLSLDTLVWRRLQREAARGGNAPANGRA